MSAKRFALLVLICLCSGCSLVSNTLTNLHNEVWMLHQEKQEQARYLQLARTAWMTYAAGDQGGSFSQDFVVGFEDGFIDYLFWGGKQCSSPVAMSCYRRGPLNTPEGAQAFRDWYEGFRVGHQAAIVAHADRHDITLPIADLPHYPTPPCVLGQCHPLPLPSGQPVAPGLPLGEPLHMPIPSPSTPAQLPPAKALPEPADLPLGRTSPGPTPPPLTPTGHQQDESLALPNPIQWPVEAIGTWQPRSEVSK